MPLSLSQNKQCQYQSFCETDLCVYWFSIESNFKDFDGGLTLMMPFSFDFEVGVTLEVVGEEANATFVGDQLAS